jgi:hypothetical protein
VDARNPTTVSQPGSTPIFLASMIDVIMYMPATRRGQIRSAERAEQGHRAHRRRADEHRADEDQAGGHLQPAVDLYAAGADARIIACFAAGCQRIAIPANGTTLRPTAAGTAVLPA